MYSLILFDGFFHTWLCLWKCDLKSAKASLSLDDLVTTNIWAHDNWLALARICPTSLKYMQIYHSGSFAYIPHWCMMIVWDSYIGGERGIEMNAPCWLESGLHGLSCGKNHSIPPCLVAIQWLQKSFDGSMMNDVGHTKSYVWCCSFGINKTMTMIMLEFPNKSWCRACLCEADGS